MGQLVQRQQVHHLRHQPHRPSHILPCSCRSRRHATTGFTDDPKVILQGLQDNYWQMTPVEKTKMEADWSAAWNPSEPTKILFDRLEDCYVLSVSEKLAYTQEQIIDKALTAIQCMGLYPTAILEYQAFPTKKNWAEFKNHFAET